MKLTFFISEIEALKESGPREAIAILSLYSIEYKCESKNKTNFNIYIYRSLENIFINATLEIKKS